ncbi:hypothetical protein BDQ12DRAFT_740003 [Crucibulum laeve]|uniref:RING-type domain-containing protein n=1 Tax=Crucibulum laeve TaxID=68775 RepID=A0A5C3LF69_9AGAR|nr:hypothetical protein BDQ12DRAFT_740003 [Crucibulum laeve]
MPETRSSTTNTRRLRSGNSPSRHALVLVRLTDTFLGLLEKLVSLIPLSGVETRKMKEKKRRDRKKKNAVVLKKYVHSSDTISSSSSPVALNAPPTPIAENLPATTPVDFNILRNTILSLQNENAEMRAREEQLKNKIVLDTHLIEDYIVCELCSLTLWSPFMLIECGHAFCKSCIEKWFQTQSMRQYTCPKCRENVTTRPAEDFVLKSLVNLIAEAGGGCVPKQNGSVTAREIWESFFNSS